MNHYSVVVSTPIGYLGVITKDEHVIKIDFLDSSFQFTRPKDSFSKRVAKELLEYFLKDPTHTFGLPVSLTGTPLQKKVWQRLRKIPAGKTITYSDLAEQIKTHSRVIGNICRANPIPIIIPCHRVVGKNSVGGFCGQTKGRFLDTKEWLLTRERS